MFEFIKNAEKDVQIIHVTGKRFYDEFMEKLKKNNIRLRKNIRIFPYFYQMPEALNIATLVITCWGHYLVEISAVGTKHINT